MFGQREYGCLIEDRLGKKAFVYGNITKGQCQKAVKLANEWLEKPIDPLYYLDFMFVFKGKIRYTNDNNWCNRFCFRKIFGS